MRVLTSAMILGLCTACVQDLPAPVEYQGGRVFGKDAQYAQNGNELPKYSADNPAELPEWQEDRYTVPAEKAEYDVAAEFDAIDSAELAPPTLKDIEVPASIKMSELDAAESLETPDIGDVRVDTSNVDAFNAGTFEQAAAPVEYVSPETSLSTPPSLEVQEAVEIERDLINPQKSGFIWPVRGEIVQAYTKESRGINIAARKGTPIRAVNDGVVQYAGNKIKGYGNLVIVAHNNGYFSAYAHADDIVVAKGASVVQGQLIGFVGNSGAVEKSQLYFSLRNGKETQTAVNPIPLLSDD